jgi:radical SAM superfamily enzyme YgiQ (UPF0313 family)
MRALLVQGRSEPTYWSYDFSLRFIAKDAALPPLGLATLAALLPPAWELRLVDLNVRPLGDAQLDWADVVLVSGMMVQAGSMQEVVARARRRGRRTVVGGPAATSTPELFAEADHVFRGEAEGRLEALVAALESGAPGAPHVLSPPELERPAMRDSPVPRFDLLELRRYASLSVQYSRGCPFLCEFCDIVELFGRVPRVKSPDQVVAELDALYRAGGRGSLFFVDDNFIGNRREVARLLPRVAAWQEANGRPFDLYTEASIDLAGEPKLVEGMVAAGFSAVFLGIETPSTESLAAAGKRQNLRIDAATAVGRLTSAGLEVFSGFIIGFDTDGPDIFDRQIDFICELPIPRAMVGLLNAAPGTALWRRLEREGRLRHAGNGDQFQRPNFEPVLDEATLLAGYRRVLATIYSDEAYYHRCELHLRQAFFPPTPARQGGLRSLLRAVMGIGLRGPRRRHFWKLAARSALQGPRAFVRAISLAVLGEHLIRYTREVVLPRIDHALAELDALARPSSRTALAPPDPVAAFEVDAPSASVRETSRVVAL